MLLSKSSLIIPPLLEGRISPSYRVVARHLEYLQRWRQYLFHLFIDASNGNADRTDIQREADQLIAILLLIDFVRRSDDTAVPTVEETLRTVAKPTAFSVAATVNNQVRSKLLKLLFDPVQFSHSRVQLRKELDLSCLADISEAIGNLYHSRMPITIFGDFYQLCRCYRLGDKTNPKDPSARHNTGIYYTPAPLVDYLVLQVFEKAFDKLEVEQVPLLRILDPSCGCGAFLVAALHYVLKWFESKCDDVKRRRPSPQQCLDILESMINGVDIDQQAVEWTRRLLLLTVWDFCVRRGIGSFDAADLRIPTLENSIACRDFLREPSRSGENRAKVEEGIFNIILGSPPFVNVQHLSKSYAGQMEYYKKRFVTARVGQFDLYMLFVERAIQILANGGYLGMSLSNTFLRSNSGSVLRALIAGTCDLQQVVEFEDNRLYPGATVQISLIMICKTAGQSPTKYVFIKGRGGLRRKLAKIDKTGVRDASVRIRHLPSTSSLSANWTLASETESEFLTHIASRGTPLEKLSLDVCSGLATGADAVFLLKHTEHLSSGAVLAESKFLNDLFVLEPAILKPILRGRHIRGYMCPQSNTLCVFPYDDSGNVIDEGAFRSRFPRTYEYLSLCRNKLGSRHLKPDQPWYAFAGEKIIRTMQSPKLVAGRINSGRAFAIDSDGKLLCGSSVITLWPQEQAVNLYFLLAVLNSSVFQRWAENKMPALGYGWLAYRLGPIRRFPVPIGSARRNRGVFNEIVGLAHSLSHGQVGEEDRNTVISIIDRRVWELYGMPPATSPGRGRKNP